MDNELEQQLKTAVANDEYMAAQLTVDEIRAYLEGEELEQISLALDEAQGSVFAGEAAFKFLIIKVVP